MRGEAQVFLHVLGAITLFGATAAVAVLGLAGRRRAEQLPLARAAFAIMLGLAIPAWTLMLAFGTWAKSKADWPDDLGWLGIGYAVSDVGLILLLVTTGLAFWWRRRPTGGWQPTLIGILACAYLGALAVAWWAMAGKVPSS